MKITSHKNAHWRPSTHAKCRMGHGSIGVGFTTMADGQVRTHLMAYDDNQSREFTVYLDEDQIMHVLRQVLECRWLQNQVADAIAAAAQQQGGG